MAGRTPVPEQKHKGPQTKEKKTNSPGELCASRLRPSSKSAASAGEEDNEPARPKPTKHHRTSCALRTSGAAHRKRRNPNLCGTSAGVEPRTCRPPELPPPSDDVEEEHQLRQPATTSQDQEQAPTSNDRRHPPAHSWNQPHTPRGNAGELVSATGKKREDQIPHPGRRHRLADQEREPKARQPERPTKTKNHQLAEAAPKTTLDVGRAEAHLLASPPPPSPTIAAAEAHLPYYSHAGDTDPWSLHSPAAEAGGEGKDQRSGRRRNEGHRAPPFSPLSGL